jgi:hypothetical protein
LPDLRFASITGSDRSVPMALRTACEAGLLARVRGRRQVPVARVSVSASAELSRALMAAWRTIHRLSASRGKTGERSRFDPLEILPIP